MQNVKMAAICALVLGMASAPRAQAAYIVTLEQVGSDVVAAGSGSIDLTDLTFDNSEDSLSSMAPEVAEILLGGAASEQVSTYGGATGPSNFGPGPVGQVALASSGNGAGVGISDENYIAVPLDYVSSSPLGMSTATWADTTLAALGVTDGIYSYTWGSGADADSFTLYAGVNPSAVPEPGTLLLTASFIALVRIARARSRNRRPS